MSKWCCSFVNTNSMSEIRVLTSPMSRFFMLTALFSCPRLLKCWTNSLNSGFPADNTFSRSSKIPFLFSIILLKVGPLSVFPRPLPFIWWRFLNSSISVSWTQHSNMKLGWWVNFRNQFFLLIWVNKQWGELNAVELPQHCTLLQTICAIFFSIFPEVFHGSWFSLHKRAFYIGFFPIFVQLCSSAVRTRME